MRVPVQSRAIHREANHETRLLIGPLQRDPPCGPTSDCPNVWPCPEGHVCGPCWYGIPTCLQHYGTGQNAALVQGNQKQGKGPK